jgi:hypothetical protein
MEVVTMGVVIMGVVIIMDMVVRLLVRFLWADYSDMLLPITDIEHPEPFIELLL